MATLLLASATALILANWHGSVHNAGDLALLLVLSVFAYVAGELSLPAFQIDVGLVLALAAIILTGPIGALVVLIVPELLRAHVERHRVRPIATMANLASFAWMVLLAQAVLLALPTHATVLGRVITYSVVATVMVLANFLLTRGIVAGLVDRNLLSGRRDELRALAACLALAPFAVVTACLLPVFGILALVAAAVAEATLGVLVRAVTWTPRAGRLTVAEARARYAAALASELSFSPSERRVVLGAARAGTARTTLRCSRGSERDRIAKALILAGLWSSGPDDCFSRLQPAEMGLESRVLVVAHGWAELTASGTEQLEHRIALLTLHNNPSRYDRRIVAAAHDLIADGGRAEQGVRVPYARELPRRIAQLRLVA